MKRIKLLITIAIIAFFVWFLVLSPMITFRKNEKKIENAARRYFEFHDEELPTGERVKTLSLSVLYKQSYLKENILAPISNKACSIENSWVKVKKENGNYKYYTFLDCGAMTSTVDHKGPVIKLKGENEIAVSIGEEFEDPGVSSIVDDRDGKLSNDIVTTKGEVDTTTVGSYEIEYTAYDSLNNKTTVKRTVNVVKYLNSLVKQDLGDEKTYKGNPNNNYVRLSNMYFRIIGLDANENVILVAEEDIANVGYDKLNKWLEEVYLKHFTKEAKKYLVKSKFCNMKLTEDELNSTDCSSFTNEQYAYVPSVIDINDVQEGELNFLKPVTISWTANSKDSSNAYVTRSMFYGDEYGKSYMLLESKNNYGVRPKIVIKGKSLVIDGDGSHDDPYVFGETKKAKGGSLLNERYTGEYIISNGFEWRIIDTLSDGTTRVISDDTLGNLTDRPEGYTNPEDTSLTFNPKDKENYAYFVNNQSSKYIDTELFIVHNVTAPVYKKTISYGTEEKTNEFKLKISPPNMYDMFSAQSTTRGGRKSHSYWLINSTTNTEERYAGAITDIGVVMNEPIQKYDLFGIRAVGYIKSGTVITSGEGTYSSPYKLK